MKFKNFIKSLSENEKKVFGLMKYEMGQIYRTLEESTKIEKKELKKIIKELKELGLIQVGSFISPDGEQGYFGRGWTLTDYGENVKNNLNDKCINV